MIVRRLRLIVVAFAASLAWMGCQPAVQTPVENQKGRLQVQQKARPKPVRYKLDDDSTRVRLLMLETVQKDLDLTADQTRKLRDLVEIDKGLWQEFVAKSREILPPSRHFTLEESETREQEFIALSEDFRRKGKELQTKALAMLTPS